MSLLDFVLSVLRAFGFEDFQAKLSTRPPEKSVGEDELWDEATEGLRAALDRSGLGYITDEGGGVLRPEDRRRRQGRDRSGVAAVDHPARLQPARTLRSRVHRQRRRAQATGDDPSGADGFGRALLRRADRALCRCLPGMAGTDPGAVLPVAEVHADPRTMSPLACARRASGSMSSARSNNSASESGTARSRSCRTSSWSATTTSRTTRSASTSASRHARARRHRRRLHRPSGRRRREQGLSRGASLGGVAQCLRPGGRRPWWR